MRKKSALALTMIGGLQAAATTWAGVAPLIEAMRQTEVTAKADKRQGLLLPDEAGPPAGLAEVSRHVVRAYMQNVKVEKKVTLDIDAHLVETDKAQARRCYQRYKAFQPIEVCWAETGLVLADE